MQSLHTRTRDGIFKLLLSPGIDSLELIPPGYVACVGILGSGGPVRQPYSYSVSCPHGLFLKFQHWTGSSLKNSKRKPRHLCCRLYSTNFNHIPTKYIYTKSTTVSDHSSELGPPPLPLPQASVSLPASEGLGEPHSDDWRKSLALCLICDIPPSAISA